MQFHLDGFQVGDPRVRPVGVVRPSVLPDEVDVLIVGCGPAGLVLAAQLAEFPRIATRIVEAASQGERDPDRLHDQALKAFDIEKPPIVSAA